MIFDSNKSILIHIAQTNVHWAKKNVKLQAKNGI
jgi:hypothetical protein